MSAYRFMATLLTVLACVLCGMLVGTVLLGNGGEGAGTTLIVLVCLGTLKLLEERE